MLNSIKIKLKQKFCDHSQTVKSSCPYTMKTYTNCVNCEKRLSVVSDI